MSEIRVDTISEKTSANGVSIDSVTLKDGAITATAASTITTADNTDTLTLISTDADAASGPNLRLRRDSSSPADDDDLGHIFFSGEDAAGNETNYITFDVITKTVADGSENGLLQIKTMSAGTLLELAAFQADGIIFNERSNDLDFRVESNGNANMLHVNGGSNLVGIGADPDLGAGLHIKIADSGATATAHGDELVIEDGTSGANVGMSILCNANGEARINFGDSDDNDIGGIYYEHVDDRMEFVVNNAVGLNIINGPKLATFSETAPDVDQGGLCLNQGGDDGNILTFKSSDVAHGMTAIAETDTYVEIRKENADEGGIIFTTLSEDDVAFRHEAFITTANTAESSAATSAWAVDARKKNGTSVTGMAADDNLASFRHSDEAQFIIKGDGELFSNTTGTVGTFDSYEDAQLVRAYDLSHMKGVIDSKFDKFVQYNKDDLQKARLIGTDDDGNATPFVNITGMSRLHNGAIWQQYEKHQKLASAFYKLAEKTIGKEEADKLLTEEEIQLLN